MDAWERQDVGALVALLRADAVLTMPPRPSILGAGAIGAFFATACGGLAELRAAPGAANGRPAVLLRLRDGSADRLLVLEAGDDGRVAEIRAFAVEDLAAFAVVA